MRIHAFPETLSAVVALLAVAAAQAHPVDRGTTRTECEREAVGRGFAVLEAGDPRDHKDGWSIAMRLRGSRGEVSRARASVTRAPGTSVSMASAGATGAALRPSTFSVAHRSTTVATSATCRCRGRRACWSGIHLRRASRARDGDRTTTSSGWPRVVVRNSWSVRHWAARRQLRAPTQVSAGSSSAAPSKGSTTSARSVTDTLRGCSKT
jgi:hypothetical protein